MSEGSEELIGVLGCPDCGCALDLLGSAWGCPHCGARHEAGRPLSLFPLSAPRPSDRASRRAFERQWRAYAGLRRLFGKGPDEMAANLVGARISSRIDRAWYRGKRVLDAGCGHGRYLRLFRDLGARAVGLDAGPEPRSAREPGISFVQGDVLAPPFRERSFDLVFCDGVLHHTSDPKKGYLALARLVRPGGALYVWLYPKEGLVREAGFRAARAVTTRLPDPAVRTLAFALAPLTAGVRSYSGTRFGRATWGECAQVVHDWIAPRLQSHHDFEEVAGWAREAGLWDVERLPVPTGVTAWRPADPSAGDGAGARPPPGSRSGA